MVICMNLREIRTVIQLFIIIVVEAQQHRAGSREAHALVLFEVPDSLADWQSGLARSQ